MDPELHTPTSSFAEEISSIPGGEGINKCIQCGLCTASCVIARTTDRYHPRKLIQKILLGKRNEVLTDRQPWLCMTCRMCEERCQEGVSPAEIFHAVRQIAAREGHVPTSFRKAVDKVLNDGWMLADAYSDWNEDERADLGLSPDLGWNKTFANRVRRRYLSEGSAVA
ncbi:MAG: 4Fe-4S dicluster domain-containing protein [Candidatus Thorarchaeota archaeon]|nr:4Fe-4S dicluster domain-containing protein [Candidatus Thorarchaeota archaeon]